MKEYFANDLIDTHKRLLQCTFSSTPEEKVLDNLAAVRKEAFSLGLRSTAQGINRVIEACENRDDAEKHRLLQSVHERFADDLVTLFLFYLPQDHAKYYQNTVLFGEQFKETFPRANAEIIEAGSCFACDRYTACAYHLSRATEIVLRVLFVSLGMPPRIWSTTKWKSITDRIGRKIQKNNVLLANDTVWQADRQFYEKAHAFLEAARNPLRNATVHVDVTYPDEGSVHPVWLATEAFLRHVATKLKE